MEKINVAKLQRQTAELSNSLVKLTESIDTQVIPLIGEDSFMLEVQCRLQLGKCNILMDKANTIVKGFLSWEGDPSLSPILRQSVSVSKAIAEQDILLIQSKIDLLSDILDHAIKTDTNLKAADKMEETAKLFEFKKKLREEKQ